MTYDVTAADIGKAITVRATATRPGYQTGTSTSNAITGVQANTPIASVPVTITGTGFHGSTLTLSPPTWDTPGVTTTYQWYRDASTISGQTGTTYVVGTSDVGKAITVRATGTKSGYGTATSTSNAINAALNPAPQASPPVSITGTGEFGTTFTLTAPTWDTSGVTTTYQWYRDASTISGQTGTTYTVGTVRRRQVDHGAGDRDQDRLHQRHVDEQRGDRDPGRRRHADDAAVHHRRRRGQGDPDREHRRVAGQRHEVLRLPVVRQRRGRRQGDRQDLRRPHQGRRPAGLVRVTMSMTGFTPSVANSAALAVAKLTSTTTASLEKKKITERERGVLEIEVDLLDLGVTLGQVQVKDGSKVIAITGLQTGEDGKLTIRLKKLKVGKHKLTVSYLGSVSTLAVDREGCHAQGDQVQEEVART